MARCPFARWEPIPPQKTREKLGERAPSQVQTQLILHSADGSYTGSLSWWESKFKWGIYSTFFVLNDGELIQLMDTSARAEANSTANARAISVETEDYGDPDHRGWAPKQVETLIELAKWVHEEHGIPLVPCPDHDQPGIGFHSMWSDVAAVSPWISESKTVKAKTCPGIARIPQFFDEVMRGLGYPAAGSELDAVYARWSSDPRKREIKPPRRRRRRGKRLGSFQRLRNNEDAFTRRGHSA